MPTLLGCEPFNLCKARRLQARRQLRPRQRPIARLVTLRLPAVTLALHEKVLQSIALPGGIPIPYLKYQSIASVENAHEAGSRSILAQLIVVT